jgi:transcription factor SPN1
MMLGQPCLSTRQSASLHLHSPFFPTTYVCATERAARLDAILQNKKKKAPRKRKPGEEDLDEMADEEVYRLRQSMDMAAENDKEAVQDGRPAIEKLKLLPEVVAVLQKWVYQRIHVMRD